MGSDAVCLGNILFGGIMSGTVGGAITSVSLVRIYMLEQHVMVV